MLEDASGVQRIVIDKLAPPSPRTNLVSTQGQVRMR